MQAALEGVAMVVELRLRSKALNQVTELSYWSLRCQCLCSMSGNIREFSTPSLICFLNFLQ